MSIKTTAVKKTLYNKNLPWNSREYVSCIRVFVTVSKKKSKHNVHMKVVKVFLTDGKERKKRKRANFLRKFQCIEGLAWRCIKLRSCHDNIVLKTIPSAKVRETITMGNDSKGKRLIKNRWLKEFSEFSKRKIFLLKSQIFFFNLCDYKNRWILRENGDPKESRSRRLIGVKMCNFPSSYLVDPIYFMRAFVSTLLLHCHILEAEVEPGKHFPDSLSGRTFPFFSSRTHSHLNQVKTKARCTCYKERTSEAKNCATAV